MDACRVLCLAQALMPVELGEFLSAHHVSDDDFPVILCLGPVIAMGDPHKGVHKVLFGQRPVKVRPDVVDPGGRPEPGPQPRRWNNVLDEMAFTLWIRVAITWPATPPMTAGTASQPMTEASHSRVCCGASIRVNVLYTALGLAARTAKTYSRVMTAANGRPASMIHCVRPARAFLERHSRRSLLFLRTGGNARSMGIGIGLFNYAPWCLTDTTDATAATKALPGHATAYQE